VLLSQTVILTVSMRVSPGLSLDLDLKLIFYQKNVKNHNQ